MLSGCTVGRINITTVEAKVQSVFDFKDIIDHIMDPRCLLIAKSRLALFLFNAVIEVEIMIPEIPMSMHVWRLLESFVDVLHIGATHLEDVEKNGWEGSSARRQEIEYMMVAVMNIAGFFQTCYDPSKIKNEESALAGGDVMNLSPSEVNDLISTLFDGVKSIYDINSSILDDENKHFLVDAMDKSAGRSLITEVAGRPMTGDFEEDEPRGGDDEEEEDTGKNNEERIARKYEEFHKQRMSHVVVCVHRLSSLFSSSTVSNLSRT